MEAVNTEQDYYFDLPSVDDGFVGLGDFTDKKGLVVLFTCNHCPYAIAYEDRLNPLRRELEAMDIALVAICSNDAERYPQDGFEGMKERAKVRGFEFPYLHDESQEVARAYGAQRTPHVFLLDLQGEEPRIAYQGSIDDNYAAPAEVKERYLIDAARALAENRKIPLAETPPVGCTIKWKE